MLCPREIVEVSRGHAGDTNVLRTTFRCARGVLRLTDAMSVLSEDEARRELHPQVELIRSAECVEGEAVLDARYQPRPDYARRAFLRRGALGWLCAHRGTTLWPHGDMAFAPGAEAGTLEASRCLRRGEACRVPHAAHRPDRARRLRRGAGRRFRRERLNAVASGGTFVPILGALAPSVPLRQRVLYAFRGRIDIDV